MAKKGSFSKVYDKNGDYAEVEAVRFDGTRTVQMQGDVTASQTWDGDPSAPLTLNTSIGAKKVTTDKINDKAVQAQQIDDGAVGLTQIATNAMNGTVQDNDSKLATHSAVKTYVDSQISGQGTYLGKHTVAEINAFVTDNLHNGDRVMVSDSGTINLGPGGVGFDVEAGEDLIFYKSGSTVQWDSMDGNFKTKQTAVDDPTASGTGLTFIDSISQDENGEITPTKKSVQDGTTSQKGVVQLEDSTSSTSTTKAATPNSVKSAYDLANGKYSKPSGGIPKSDLASGVQASLDKADSALQGVKLAGASSALTPDADKVVMVPNAVPTGTGETNGLMTAADKAKLDGITSGANKVAASNTNGNIKIDGTETNVYTHPSAGPSSATSVGDTTNQTPAFGGSFKTISQTVNTDGHTTATSEHTVTLPTDGKDLTSTVATVDNYTNPGSTATALKTLFGKIWNFIGRLRTSWQTTPDDTHFPSEKLVKDSLDTKASLINSVAIFDGYVRRIAEDNGWDKVATKTFAKSKSNVNALFRLYGIGSDKTHSTLFADLVVNIRFGNDGTAPTLVHNRMLMHQNINIDAKIKIVGNSGNAVVELWLHPSQYMMLFITCIGNGEDVSSSNKDWIFSKTPIADKDEPVPDTSNNIYVFNSTKKYVQYDIDSPTNNNLVAMNANGLVKDSGVAVLPSTSTWDGTSDAKVPTVKAVQAKIDGKQDALPTSGTASSTYAIDISGKSSSSGDVVVESIGSTPIDLDTLIATDGHVHFYYWSFGNQGNVSNKPYGGSFTLQVLPIGAGSFVMQIAYPRNSTGFYMRSRPEGSAAWSPWENVRDASWINSGVFDAARIPTSLPNVTAGSATNYASGGGIANALDEKASALDGERYSTFYGFVIKKPLSSSWYNGYTMTVKMGYGGSTKRYEFGFRLSSGTSDKPVGSGGFCRYTVHGDDGYEIGFRLYTKVTDAYLEVMVVGSIGTGCILEYGISLGKDKVTVLTANPSTEGWTSREWDYVRHFQIPPVTDIAYVAAQSGGGGNLNKTINGTTTSVLTFMNDSEAVAIWADAKTAAANAS